MKIAWRLGTDGADFKSEEFEIEVLHENREEDKLWHSIDIRDLGEKPVNVPEG